MLAVAARFLERRQAVAEFDAGDVMTEPRMVRWWECIWIVEARGSDVDVAVIIGARIGQLRAALIAELAIYVGRGTVVRGFAFGDC